ncbi:uncharacterized protein I303_107230 [Kwoniella dejecticola CBS 10117]|uniref:Uncharacterized protein n=1 Tax=Kwoniella dejecticola CBS 10117 TaxID=1296121 RepID=A0A1A5ZZ34_9TREE|nr:uncharacterized protein I303_06631 [Kwoniella dejecticola CBS 10117]OBR83072.1 hypothetical protein I303_06631 [Kwoniella dejecticola CBS 10117]
MSIEHINLSEKGPNESKGMMPTLDFSQFAWASQYKLVGKPLIEKYQSEHGGRYPPLGSAVAKRWGWAEEHEIEWTTERFDEARKKLKESGKVLNENVVGSDPDTITRKILIDLMNPWKYPMYRESKIQDESDRLTPLTAKPLSYDYLPAYTGGPAMIIPFDQIPFRSKMSKKSEWHPLSAVLMGYPGSELAEAGVIRTVNTGVTAFDEAE